MGSVDRKQRKGVQEEAFGLGVGGKQCISHLRNIEHSIWKKKKERERERKSFLASWPLQATILPSAGGQVGEGVHM